MQTRKKMVPVLILLIVLTAVCFTIFWKSVQNGETWRIVFSGIGLTGFLFLTISLARRFISIKKN